MLLRSNTLKTCIRVDLILAFTVDDHFYVRRHFKSSKFTAEKLNNFSEELSGLSRFSFGKIKKKKNLLQAITSLRHIIYFLIPVCFPFSPEIKSETWYFFYEFQHFTGYKIIILVTGSQINPVTSVTQQQQQWRWRKNVRTLFYRTPRILPLGGLLFSILSCCGKQLYDLYCQRNTLQYSSVCMRTKYFLWWESSHCRC